MNDTTTEIKILCVKLFQKECLFLLSGLGPDYWDFICFPEDQLRHQSVRTTGGGLSKYHLSHTLPPLSNLGHKVTRTKGKYMTL